MGLFRSHNPTPQDAGSIQAFAASWFGVTLTSLVDANDKSGTSSTLSGTGFSTTTTANVYAVHFGGGELAFLFNTAVALSLSNWTGPGLAISALTILFARKPARVSRATRQPSRCRRHCRSSRVESPLLASLPGGARSGRHNAVNTLTQLETPDNVPGF